jgi:hypothetical protein
LLLEQLQVPLQQSHQKNGSGNQRTGDTRLRSMLSGNEPRRNSTRPRGTETGSFRTKTLLQDFEASYGSVQTDTSGSFSEIPPSPRFKQEPRRSSSCRRRSSGSNRDTPPELHRKSSGGTDNQRRTSLGELEAAALSSSGTQSPGTNALEAAALGSYVTVSPGAGNQIRTSFCELEAAALGSSGTVSPIADNPRRTSLSDLEAAALMGASGALSQEAKKAFVSRDKSRLGSYIAKQGPLINKETDWKTAKSSQSHESAAVRPRSSFLTPASSEGTASSHDGSQPLSTKQLEAEKRNLDRLKRKDDIEILPGAYAAAMQFMSSSNSTTPPTSGIGSAVPTGRSRSLGPVQSLRKHSTGHSTAIQRNASFRGGDMVDNSSGRQHSIASERSTGSKS